MYRDPGPELTWSWRTGGLGTLLGDVVEHFHEGCKDWSQEDGGEDEHDPDNEAVETVRMAEDCTVDRVLVLDDSDLSGGIIPGLNNIFST